jgi:hypothetical protein
MWIKIEGPIYWLLGKNDNFIIMIILFIYSDNQNIINIGYVFNA